MDESAPEIREPDAVASAEEKRLVFKGVAREYFRIWVVNLLLTIVTLGIYSACAKVRKRQYFYRSTFLDGQHFDYHANPVAILKGRLIAVPILIVYFASAYYMPGLDLGILFLIVLLLPWLLVRSQIFNRRNTSYRNVRFDFARHYKRSYGLFFKYGVLALVTLGLAYPVLDFKRREFIVNSTSFGSSAFRFSGTPGEYFFIYLKAAGLAFVMLIVGIILLTILVALYPGEQPTPQDPGLSPVVTFAPLVLMMLVYIPVIAYTQAKTQNYTYLSTHIESSGLVSRLRGRDLAVLYITNILAIIFSVGFLIPWASIRMARYRAAQSGANLADSLDGFTATHVADSTATGQEIAEAFEFEVGF